MTRQILVTSALPYANGPIHLGHLVEYIQTDIWVRFMKLQGHECYFVCADDAHGTPIMLRAHQEHRSPEALIAEMSEAHQQDFAGFHIAFDHYHSTHSPENRELSSLIYGRLREAGHIRTQTIQQLYDPQQQMFLPDRFIKGGCPRCQAPNQYGDNCEVCGATYNPTDLINPVSVLSGQTPIEKQSEHYFFRLTQFQSALESWINAGHLPPEVAHKLKEWFASGLKDWDISRDAPYFGFEIPDAPGKYFYVWLDAPIGYMASFKALCDRNHLNFDHFWRVGSSTELYHFVGKDIVNFHGLFWPAVLMGAGFRTPTALFVHGFLTVDGAKMSKSKGTFITASAYLKHLNPEYLRYYLASKLSAHISDLDLNLEDFSLRVNADLVNKVVNIASRCARFIQEQFSGQLAATLAEPERYDGFVTAGTLIAQHYEQREFGHALREMMALADQANQYIDAKKPWVLSKQGDLAAVQAVCSLGLNLFRVLMIYLKPVLPAMALEVEAFLNQPPLTWDDRYSPLLSHRINPFKPLMTRVDPKAIAALLEDSKDTLQPIQEAIAPVLIPPQPAIEPIAPVIDIADFAKLDLRVARILKAEAVEGADKLLRLQLDLGSEQRQVMAGIKAAYAPTELEGRLTVMVANLAPRTMRFGVSEGMVLAAGLGGSELWLLAPDSGAQPGMRIK